MDMPPMRSLELFLKAWNVSTWHLGGGTQLIVKSLPHLGIRFDPVPIFLSLVFHFSFS